MGDALRAATKSLTCLSLEKGESKAAGAFVKKRGCAEGMDREYI